MKVERGTRIISQDTVVTQRQLEMLSYMQEHAMGYSILELVGRLIFIVVVTITSVAVFLRVLDKESRIYLYLNMMLSSVLISLLAMHLVSSFLQNRSMLVLDSFLPLFFAPLFVAHISSKRRLGFITAFLLACYATLMREATLMTFFFILSVNAINLNFFRYSIKRLEDLFNWFFAVVSSSVAALAFSPLSAVAIHSLPTLIISLVVNITASLILVQAFVPLMEYLFNIPTAYRLNELASTDSPILERLGAVAQGTYNHSRNVSELAYQAAKAIGANAMLARVGGVYHDIGKVDHPEYFVENQGTENKHDDIKASLSVAVIKSHVKLGLEKGREAGLPQEVLDIISQHHGNDIIQYFYSEAARQAQASGVEINADDYSYTGEPPNFPESAIVMLADIVEAASRTLKQPTYSKYQKLVHTLVMGKIERGQLNQSHLSLTDLNRIEESFVQTLIGRDHHRIEYPEE
jgi:putative nucleotidyltransferase with HDIG domain